MKLLPIQLANKETVGDTPNVLVADSATETLYLRRFTKAGSVYTYVDEIEGILKADGLFYFPITSAYYQCWKSAYPDATAGNRVDAWHGVIDAVVQYRWENGDTVDASYTASGTLDTGRIPTLPQSKVTDLVDDLEDKASLTQPNDFLGALTFEEVTTIRQPISTDYADDDLDAAGGNLITNNRLEHRLGSVTGYQYAPRVIRVNPNLTAETGKIYNSILAAVNYAVSQTPAANKVFNIHIESMATAATNIVAESGSFQNYVNLRCVEPNITVLCVGDTINANMQCLGGKWFFGAGESNGSNNARTLQYMSFKENAQVNFYRNGTIKGGVHDATFKVANGYGLTFSKDANNVYPLFEEEATFRQLPTFTDEDNWTVPPQYKVLTGLTMETDPTVSA